MHLLSFSGKSDRFEWWVVSLLADLAFQASLIFGFLAIAPEEGQNYLVAVVLFMVAAVSLWLAVAVSVRRLRDRGRPPWFLAFALVPVAGWIWYVVECGFLAAPGQKRRRVVRRTVGGTKAESEITPNP